MTLPTENHNLLSSMVATPKGVCFEAQRPDEEVLLVLRAHPVTQVPWILAVFIFALAPIFLFPLVVSMLPDFFDLDGSIFSLLFTVFWYLILFFYAFEKFLLWFYGVYIVTNQRLVDIDFINFFQKFYAEAQMQRVQDVASSQVGPLAVLFNYGTVGVQTAGELPNIEFEQVPSPDRISKVIGELVVQQGGVVAKPH